MTEQYSRNDLIFLVGLLVLAVLVYFPLLQAGYIWDDDKHLVDDILLNDWHGQYRIWFDPNAIKLGNSIIEQSLLNIPDVIVIDEIGIFEINEQIWFQAFSKTLKQEKSKLLVSVRESLIDEVISKFELENARIVYADDEYTRFSEQLEKDIVQS